MITKTTPGPGHGSSGARGDGDGAGHEPGVPASAELMEMIFGFQRSHALYAAAKLGIADLLSDGARSVEELARATDTLAPFLYRLLRALAGVGVFEEHEDGRFAMTRLAEPLRSDAAGGSVRGYALLVGQPFAQRPWEELLTTMRTGQTAFDQMYGTSLFEFLAEHRDAGEIFSDAMTSNTSREADAIVEAYDFGAVGTVVDVAGGHGALLAAILDANAAARGVLLERPHVIAGAADFLRTRKAVDRCSLVEGDMFASVPAGGDAYVLKRVMHDWTDERALTILENCRRAMTADGRVLVIDLVIPAGNGAHPSKFYDLMMLVIAGGRERTEKQFAELFAAAGLTLTRIIPTRSPVAIVEAIAASHA